MTTRSISNGYERELAHAVRVGFGALTTGRGVNAARLSMAVAASRLNAPKRTRRAVTGSATRVPRESITTTIPAVTASTVTARPRTMRERAAIRRAMGDRVLLVDTEPRSQGPRQRAYASAWTPATTLPRDLIGDLYAATAGPNAGAVLPLHCERVAGVQIKPERVTIIHERVYGNGPDQGVRVVTLVPARDVLGLLVPDTWTVADVRVTTMPEPLVSRGASRRKLRYPDHLDVSQPRVTGVR